MCLFVAMKTLRKLRRWKSGRKYDINPRLENAKLTGVAALVLCNACSSPQPFHCTAMNYILYPCLITLHLFCRFQHFIFFLTPNRFDFGKMTDYFFFIGKKGRIICIKFLSSTNSSFLFKLFCSIKMEVFDLFLSLYKLVLETAILKHQRPYWR